VPRGDGIPVTSEAFALRLTNRAALLTAVKAAGPRRGVRRLRTLLDAGPKRTRSAPERRLLSLLRDAGLPEPLTNHKIGPWEVDFFWPDQSFVVEVDAYSTHLSPFAFERDRRKDAELSDHGLTVLRVTKDQLRDQPEQVVARLRRRTT
jgi:very-short-patch-repair endonuclease